MDFVLRETWVKPLSRLSRVDFLSEMVIKFPLLRGPFLLNLEINDTNIDDFNGFNYPG